MATFHAPRGTYDLIPPASNTHLAVRTAMAAGLRRSGYGYVETPAFEDTALFVRGVGESTDIVGKEMYTFTDKGGRSLTLRPEGTAPVLRAALEAGLHAGQLPVKLWYSGSYYRYERMQKGRYRHFAQVGAEALGSDDPALDAELVWLASRAFVDVGLAQTRLLLNTLGDRQCRPAYREALVAFLAGIDLDEETRRRAEINPLRVLDDKRPEVQSLLADAPVIAEHLCADCRAHYDAVRQYLGDLGVAFELAPRLVRGLDYYTRTTFEFVHDGLGAQSALGGGGRYDGLAESLGGPPLAGIGWALGVDRAVLALEAEGRIVAGDARCDVYLVPLGEAARRRAALLAAQLRTVGIATDLAYGGRGLKGAMRGADRSGALFTLVFGDRDLEAGVVQCKDMKTGVQQAVSLAGLVDEMKGRVG